MMQAILLGGLEDVTKEVDVTASIYEGQPVTISPASGKIVPADDTTPVYGLAKFDRNQYRDYTGVSSVGLEGRGGLKMNVVKTNLVQLMPNIYDVSPGVQLKYYQWDNTKTFLPMAKVMVDSTGKITPSITGLEVSIFGIVTVSGTDFLEIQETV